MSDIFEEVEESLRQDKATDLWKRFAPFVWAIGLTIIGAVAYREWALDQSRKEIEARMTRFEEARTKLAAGEYEAAQTEFEALAGSGEDVASLAVQFLAQTYYEGNGNAAAAAEALEAGSGIDDPLQRLALLKAAYLRADQLTLSDLEAFLGGLPAEPTALGALSLELIAAKALTEGDLNRARDEFSYLRFAPNAPQGVLQRAEIALGVIPKANEAPAGAALAVDDNSDAGDLDPSATDASVDDAAPGASDIEPDASPRTPTDQEEG